VFDLIRKIRPFFFSLREIENNVSLDIKIPTNWKFEEIIKPYSAIKFKVQDRNHKHVLLSLVANATEDGYNIVFTCALEIIIYNKEEEEKEKLFQQKLKQLQELFKKESLNKLKEINLLENYGQEIATRDNMVESRDGEGQYGNNESQEEDD
jgi:hypothetical protein